METTIFVLVFLIITGGLLLDVIPDKVIALVDTFVGRTLLFLLPGALGGLMGEGGVLVAIVVGAVAGLVLDRVHDSHAGSLVSKKLGSPRPSTQSPNTPTEGDAPFKPAGGSGGRVIRDLSPNYVGAVAKRLGLVPIMSPDERFTYGPSISILG